jgi:hypothetical protein
MALLALTLVGSTGCGGGGDGGGQTTLTFVPSTDGTVKSDGTFEASGGTRITVGDNSGNIASRGILRFGIVPFVPAGAVILSAKLRLRQQDVTGTPFPQLGTIVVDHVDPGVTIDGADYNAPVLTANIGTLSSDATGGIKEIDVTAAVVADLAGPGFNANFLVRFTSPTNSNASADGVTFDDSENQIGTGTPPQLVITYQ